MHDAFNRKLKVTCLSCFDPVLQDEARNYVLSLERQDEAFFKTGQTKLVLFSFLVSKYFSSRSIYIDELRQPVVDD